MDPKKLLVSLIGTKNNELKEIDKKIVIKIFKNGNRLRTEVCGLEDFIPVDRFKQITKDIKELHGCSGIVDDVNNKKIITFSGNQIENVKNYIISKKIATIEFIKQ